MTIRHILDVLFIAFVYIYSYLHFLTLREKCPNTKFFLVCIFPYLDWIVVHCYFVNLCIQSKYGKIRTKKKKKRGIWTLFTQCYSHSPVYTYLHLLIHAYVLFILLYEFDKIDKMGNTEITTKFSRLKSVSSIDDDYLETATGGVL